MDEVRPIPIQGYRGEAVPNTFWKNPHPADCLAVLFPGFGYSADMPVLYYPGHLARDRGCDLLQVKYNYFNNPEYRQATDNDQTAWLYADADAMLSAGLKLADYSKLILIGKSLGSMAIAHLLKENQNLPPVKILWLTPVLTDPLVLEMLSQGDQPGLIAIGKMDPYYDANLLREWEGRVNLRICAYESANHSLEIPGDIPGSLSILENLVSSVDAFFRL